AEVFLSVEAVEDGERFFRQALEAAETDVARLSSAIVLSQFLLLQKKHSAYADLAADVLAPLAARLHQKAPTDFSRLAAPEALQELALSFAGILALAPMVMPDFVSGLPEEQVRALIPRCQALEAQARDDLGWQAIDLFLHAAYGRLGKEKEKQAIAQRFTQE